MELWEEKMKFEEIIIGSGECDLHSKIQVALANVPIYQAHVEASYLLNPVVTRQRLSELARLLNDIARWRNSAGKGVDLLVFPEVSIPHAWQALLVSWARKNFIGVVAGLEHRITMVDNKPNARNEVLAALPFRDSSGHVNCIPITRLKKFYSPAEIFELENQHLNVPSTEDVLFQLFRWRGASFAIYNCFELSSIEHRALFKGKVDFVIGTEFNRDTNYFSNIVESAARDLHCYVIQVNGSQYGDTRVVAPSPSARMSPLRIKGGLNLTYLTHSLDLAGLREHQRIGYGLQKDSQDFKATPPGLDREELRRRFDYSGSGKRVHINDI